MLNNKVIRELGMYKQLVLKSLDNVKNFLYNHELWYKFETYYLVDYASNSWSQNNYHHSPTRKIFVCIISVYK